MIKRLQLYPKQDNFFRCSDRFAGFIGGIGSGKTFVGCLWAFTQAKPGTLGLVVAPTYPMLRDVSWRSMQNIASGAITDTGKSEMTLTFRGGGELMFRSADDPNRLRGPNIHYALIDEAALCPKGTWEIVEGRLRADGLAGPCRVVSTPKGRNWLYERQGEMTIFKAATKDNPFLAAEFVASLERSYTGNFARQELYGDFVAFEGLVYPMFSREINVKERKAEEFKRRWMGNDEGYTNPSVILDTGIDADGRVHIFREWYRRGQLQETVVQVNVEWYKAIHPQGNVVDSSAAGLVAALREAGISATPHKGRVQDGISKVQNLLAIAGDGRPRLTVDPSCVQTIAEFESYCWKEGRDEPEKQNDHCFIGSTPILTKKGWQPIKQIKAGDYVWSPFGWNKVYRAGKSGIKQVADYGIFKCTPDHKILTARGVVSVDTLRYSDIIMLWTNPRQYTFREFLTGVIQTPREGTRRFILGAVLTKAKMARRDTYTETYGNTITAKFLTAIWCIILTVTLAITTFAILNLSVLANTPRDIIGGIGKVWKSTWLKFKIWRGYGTLPKRDIVGTQKTVNDVGNIVIQRQKHAKYVRNNIQHPSLVEANIVLEIAEQKRYENAEVYNLATKFGMYFANGVLVSNSMDTIRYIVDAVTSSGWSRGRAK